MKESLESVGILLVCLILIIVAIVIVTLLIPFALLWKVWVSMTSENRKARDIISGTSMFFIALASSIDKFGNVAYGGFLNSLLLKESKHPFGATTETVSIVLGWAYKLNDLNNIGLLLRRFVNWVDFTVEDHCEHSRMLSINRAIKIIEQHGKQS